MTVDREAILREWMLGHRNVAADRQSEQWWLAEHDFLDLISRAVDAAYVDAAGVADARSLIRCAAAIRALIGGGE